jgi:hypothetical protein
MTTHPNPVQVSAVYQRGKEEGERLARALLDLADQGLHALQRS